MRKTLLLIWLVIPVIMGMYHYGPGQDALAADLAAAAARRGDALAARAQEVAAAEGDLAAKSLWAQAEEAYGQALESLPNERVDENRRLRLERAKAQMFVSQLPNARRDLESLVAELADDDGADPDLLADARGALANAQYYTTWLMRLEGAPREEWEAEVESSRQNYKWIAENLETRGKAEEARKAQEDLESSIRLARMDLTELSGLPLPSQ